MWARDLTEETLSNLSIIERTASAISLVGIVFIVTTFLFYPPFHKPINRLIFYASVGNLFTCVGTMISRSAIEGADITQPNLCKFQAFLIQMFMPADACWAFVMALNVYFTFYWKFRATQLKNLEVWYCLCCYGIPFVLAFLLLWVRSESRGPMYGNATLWCWISGDWDHYRMYLFYGPVWAVCIGTICIYARLLTTCLNNVIQLNSFAPHARTPPPATTFNGPITGVRTTDVSFRSDPAVQGPSMYGPPNFQLNQYPRPAPVARPYDCNVTSGDEITPAPVRLHTPAYAHLEKGAPALPPKDTSKVTNKDDPSRFVKYTTGPASILPKPATARNVITFNTLRANGAMMVMMKVSLFFFCIMLITWIPSSANRLYTVVHHNQVSLGLEYLAASVLPLQGFWNCIIYILVSQESCRKLWRSLNSGRPWTWKDVKDSLKDAFVDGYLIDRYTPRGQFDPYFRSSRSRPSTVAGNSSRPFTATDDSITLLESLENSRRTSRPKSRQPDFTSIL